MTDKVKVIHIISGLHVGGAEMMLYRLLQNTSYQEAVVVSLKSEGKVSTMIRELNIPVYHLGLTRNPFSLSNLSELTRLIEKYQPHVVQSWLYAADLLGGYIVKRNNRPIVWNIRQSETAWVAKQWHIACMQRLSAFLSKGLPDKIVYCAHTAKKSHQAIGYRKQDSLVVANGVDTDRFVRNQSVRERIRKQWGIDDDTKAIGMVGRYDVLKNQHRFLRVFSKVLQQFEQPLKAVLIGRGINEDNDALVQDIKRLGLEKHCLLLGESSEIPEIMNGLDIHLLTSDNEGWPNVLAEAMSCELPCIATKVGDVAEILGSAEYVVHVDNENEMVNACNKLLAMNNQQLRKIGEQHRQRVIEHFSLSKTVSDYDALYLSYLPK